MNRDNLFRGEKNAVLIFQIESKHHLLILFQTFAMMTLNNNRYKLYKLKNVSSLDQSERLDSRINLLV